jgi:hypothetical protein
MVKIVGFIKEIVLLTMIVVISVGIIISLNESESHCEEYNDSQCKIYCRCNWCGDDAFNGNCSSSDTCDKKFNYKADENCRISNPIQFYTLVFLVPVDFVLILILISIVVTNYITKGYVVVVEEK